MEKIGIFVIVWEMQDFYWNIIEGDFQSVKMFYK